MSRYNTINLYEQYKDYPVSLAYSGIFTDALTQSFILFCDDLVINLKHEPKKAKTINFLLCETFQNVVRHTNKTVDTSDLSIFNGYFSFHHKYSDYRINSINHIKPEDKEKAIKLIDNVNSLNKEELRVLYRDRLSEGELSEKGGAGLGFIQMARKSGKKIHYKIENSTKGIEQLHQQLMISDYTNDTHTSRLDMSNKQFQRMISEEQFLHYKGDFSAMRLRSLSIMVKENLRSSDFLESKKEAVEKCFIKMFENVEAHGVKIDGLNQGALIVTKEADSFVIEMLNPIRNSDSKVILSKLGDSSDKNTPLKTSLSVLTSNDITFEFAITPHSKDHSFLVVKSNIPT